jgi:hypothetical protein
MIGVGTLPPVIALAAWTMVMWAWMYWTRIPELDRAKLDDAALSLLTKEKLDALLPRRSSGRRTITITCTKRRRCSTLWRWCWRWSARGMA